MLIGFLCIAAVPIHISLPVVAPRLSEPATTAARSLLRHIAPAAASSQHALRTAADAPKNDTAPFAGVTGAFATYGDAPSFDSQSQADSIAPQSIVEAVIGLGWAVGAVLGLLRAARGMLMVRAILRSCVSIPATELILDMAARLHLRHLPTVVTSPEVAGPMIVGVVRPTIILPVDFAQSMSEEELRLSLAHEMAHLKRRDLILDLAPSLAHILFYFHPLVRLAVAECAACREESCDQISLTLAGSCPARYGALLIKTAARQRHGLAPIASIGMAAAHFKQMKRRLTALRQPQSRCAPCIAVGVVSIASVGATPCRIIAHSATLPKSNANRTDTLPSYNIIDLGTLGGLSSDATAIGDDGRIVGSANGNPHSSRGHAFIYTAVTGMQDVAASLPFRHSIAYAINNRGEIAAAAFDRSDRPVAVVGTPHRLRPLMGLPGFPFARPQAIDPNGTIVGTAQASRIDARFGEMRTRAVVYRGGSVIDLGTLGGPYSSAGAINDAGIVVGKADLRPDENGQIVTHAFLHDGNRMHDLGALPGGNESVATAVNRSGQIVGVSETASGNRHAFLYAGGKMADLDTLPAAQASRASAINAYGAIVGSAYFAAQDARRAVLWVPAYGQGAQVRLIDLNDTLPANSPWVLETARGINNRGQIVGQGIIGGVRRAFLLTPISPSKR